MTRLIESDISAAWSALETIKSEPGWQTLPVSTLGHCRIQAARHFPENEEAVLIGFELENPPASKKLPEGKGFRVEKVCDSKLGKNIFWVGLIRLKGGASEIFSGMVKDILTLLKDSSELPSDLLFSIFIGRIRAWQDFMSRPRSALSSEAETGLYGELCFLRLMLQKNIEAGEAINSWYGPMDGLQDFYLGSGAVEVKATLADKGFPAKIHSLEQLDDSMVQPMFVSAVRLKVGNSGTSLPALIEDIRKSLDSDRAAFSEFENRLLKAGYLDSHSEDYSRQYSTVEIRNILLDEKFPRLTPAFVPLGIRSARYEIDLDTIELPDIPESEMFKNLGVA